MAKRNVLSLKGFDDMLDKISRAGGKADEAAVKASQAGAKAYEATLKQSAAAAGVPASVTADVTNEVKQDGNRTTVKVGWKLGEYNPKNLSNGYKALFLNYGTPHRSKHGKMQPTGFISQAKKKATKQVKAAQQQELESVLKELE